MEYEGNCCECGGIVASVGGIIGSVKRLLGVWELLTLLPFVEMVRRKICLYVEFLQ